MLDNKQRGAIGRNELIGILVVAVVTVALAVTALLMSFKPEQPSPSNPAEEAAREEINRLYQEELAAARAAALAKEDARQAELNAAEDALGLLSDSSLSGSDDLPPEAGAPPTAAPAAGAPVPAAVPQPAPDPAVPSGWARTNDGQVVNIQAMIDSVRAEGTKRQKSE